MLENFSNIALGIINEVKEISKEKGIKKIGSEYLLYAMYKVEDSLTRFLFNEYKVTKEELLIEIDKVYVIRKNDKELTSSLETILNHARIIAGDTLVSDEHIFMGILMTPNSIAYQELIHLDLDIDDLILDVKEIYDFKGASVEFNYTKNITKLAKNNELSPYVGIEDYINRLLVIIKRKTKNNPILIGNAGVGKTALVEGLACYMVKNKMKEEIVSLNIGSMLAGTKYRGDFEQRLDDVVKEVAKKKNVILFIDEIHTIVGSGTTENSLDIGNMLKPFLARSDFKVIGATTPNEYHKSIEKDKALNRRFQSIYIKEPSLIDTKRIIDGIKESYMEYHKVNIMEDELSYLIEISDKRMVNKYRPDKCIDLLDEVLSYVSLKKRDQVTISDINYTLDNMIGYKKEDAKMNFSSLEKYYFLHTADLLDGNILLNIGYSGNDEGYNLLLNDLMSFGATKEMILELDLSNYNEPYLISSLIGAPPGYVGYLDEGLLSKHIMKYPLSIISIKNKDKAALSISSIFEEMKRTGFINDRVGNVISCKNVILLEHICDNEKNHIGFNKKQNREVNNFDEIITYKEPIIHSLNNKYINSLRRYGIELAMEFDVDKSNKKEIDSLIYEIIRSNKKGKITINKEKKIEY